MLPQNWRLLRTTLVSSFLAILLSFAPNGRSNAIAANSLNLQLGLWQISLSIDELQNWADTGEIPAKLGTYRWILPSETRQLLQQRFHVDQVVADSFLQQLWQHQEGTQLLEQLNTAFPKTDKETLKTAIYRTWEQTDDFSFLSFVRAYPEDTLTLDVAAVTEIGIQLQSHSLQKQLLRPQLQQFFRSSTSKPLQTDLDPSKQGEKVVYLESLTLKDRKRERLIAADVYYSRHTTGSLVVMSHGFAADRQFSAYLARHLASHGLTVVSIEHPGSNIQALVDSAYGMNLNEILPASEFIDRPQDVSFVLDELENLSQSIPHLRYKFNSQQVTLIGHSFGGYTALALAGGTLDLKGLRQFCQETTPLGRSPADWLQCAAAKLPYGQQQFRDPRIKQIIALNPIIGKLFKDLSDVRVPTLIVSASDDGITPIVPHQLQPFQQLGGEKYLLLVMGGTHMSVTDISNLNSAMAENTLVREVMGEEANPVRKAVQGISLAFIKQLTPEASAYQSFLTNTYAKSFANHQVQVYIANDLPLSVQMWSHTLDFGKMTLTGSGYPPKNLFGGDWWHYLSQARHIINKPEYCTRQVDDMLTTLLRNYS